jgi:hypothetical protein
MLIRKKNGETHFLDCPEIAGRCQPRHVPRCQRKCDSEHIQGDGNFSFINRSRCGIAVLFRPPDMFLNEKHCLQVRFSVYVRLIHEVNQWYSY